MRLLAHRLSVFCLLLFILTFAGCGSSPESVVEKFFKAAAANRVDDAIECFSLKDVKQNDLTMIKGKLQMIVGEQYSTIQEKGGLSSVKATLMEKSGDTAKVKAVVKFKNGQTDEEIFDLIKDKGWKIVVK